MRVFGLRKVRGFPQFSFSSRFRRPRILFLGHRFWSVSAMVPHLVLCRSWPSRPCVGCCCCRSLVFLLCFAGHLFWAYPFCGSSAGSSPGLVLLTLYGAGWVSCVCWCRPGIAVFCCFLIRTQFVFVDGRGDGSSDCGSFSLCWRLRPGMGLVVCRLGFASLWGLALLFVLWGVGLCFGLL